MGFNLNSIVEAINELKTNINNAYNACENKGATIPTEKTSSNLAECINSIPSGGGSYTSIGQAFSGFSVSASSQSSISINCGSIGASWRAITIYSNTKQGWFSIYKISSNICIMSSNPWYAITDDPVLENGNFPYNLESSSFRCLYSISGNTITLTVSTYVGQDSSTDISICADQISTDSSYMLDIIDIIA